MDDPVLRLVVYALAAFGAVHLVYYLIRFFGYVVQALLESDSWWW